MYVNIVFIFHMLFGLGKKKNPYWYWIHYVKWQGHKGHFCPSVGTPICFFLILRTIHHKTFTFYMPICLRKDMTPIEFVFTRSKVNDTRVIFVNNNNNNK